MDFVWELLKIGISGWFGYKLGARRAKREELDRRIIDACSEAFERFGRLNDLAQCGADPVDEFLGVLRDERDWFHRSAAYLPKRVREIWDQDLGREATLLKTVREIGVPEGTNPAEHAMKHQQELCNLTKKALDELERRVS